MISAEATLNILKKARITLNGKKSSDPQLHIPFSQLIARVLKDRSTGLGEAYMEGWWDCDDLTEFFQRLLPLVDNPGLSRKDFFIQQVVGTFINFQSTVFSSRVTKIHYDAGNDFYQRILDPYMQYSCGRWLPGTRTLRKAQEQKLEAICQKLQLKKGMKVLDLGCGWGGLARYMAEKYQVSVTAYTLAHEQAEYIRQNVKLRSIKLFESDYRQSLKNHPKGSFDAVVSVGFFEHVGWHNYKSFFELVEYHLKDGGIHLLHTIGKNRNRRTTDSWMEKYIFPGGFLPSRNDITDTLGKTGFLLENWDQWTLSYALTLREWRKNLEKHKSWVIKKYSLTFYRMYRYYFSFCEAIFLTRRIELWQIVTTKRGTKPGYRVPHV